MVLQMLLTTLGLSIGLEVAPTTSRVPGLLPAARCAAPSMQQIADPMKTLAAGMKAAKREAAAAIVEKKVAAKLEKVREKYNVPEKYLMTLGGFFTSFMTEVYMAGEDTDKYEELLSVLMKKITACVKEPYEFEPYHEAIREPFDYYALGTDFASPLVDSKQSVVAGLDQLEKIQQQIAAGDNVVLFANHQSEADPQIFSVLLDDIKPGFAEKTIFVAGDRVTTDLFATPFSMGRNLLCIFSKKHVDNPPELKSQKQNHNRMVMKKMQDLLTEGGKCIWVAPSGGRDRADEASGEYVVAPFDPKSVDMFKLMAAKSKRPAHFYPLSMFTYPICPPPQQVGGEVGERRTVKFAPAGLEFGPEVDLARKYASDPAASKGEQREATASHIEGTVARNYYALAKKLEPLMD